MSKRKYTHMAQMEPIQLLPDLLNFHLPGAEYVYSNISFSANGISPRQLLQTQAHTHTQGKQQTTDCTDDQIFKCRFFHSLR